MILAVFVLSGCATYKFQKPLASDSQGYLVSYDGKPIPEYTIGEAKSFPDLELAKERFRRRRGTVEKYYKASEQIESRLKSYFWNPPAMVAGFLWGVLRWPFIAVADYKYHHNPVYQAKVDRMDEEKEALQTARIDSLKKELEAYIQQDLSRESQVPDATSPKAAKQQPAPVLAAKPAPPVRAPEEIKPAVIEKPAVNIITVPPVAVITASVSKGLSPLKVRFSGQKSYSKTGKIVSYHWDFGDGDTSAQKNPENTYWSTTYGARSFTVTLTVRDQAGAESSATSVVEVITR